MLIRRYCWSSRNLILLGLAIFSLIALPASEINRCFRGSARSQALPGNALPARLCLAFKRAVAGSACRALRYQAEPGNEDAGPLPPEGGTPTSTWQGLAAGTGRQSTRARHSCRGRSPRPDGSPTPPPSPYVELRSPSPRGLRRGWHTWVPIRQNLRGARRFSVPKVRRRRNRLLINGLRRTRVVFICSYLAGHWDLTLGWIGGGFAALYIKVLWFPLKATGVGSYGDNLVVQTGGSFEQQDCAPGRTPARWPRLSAIRITSPGDFLIQITDFGNSCAVVGNR